VSAAAAKVERQIKRLEKQAPLAMTEQAARAIRTQIAGLRAQLRAARQAVAS
jgi:hypothetical protein